MTAAAPSEGLAAQLAAQLATQNGRYSGVEEKHAAEAVPALEVAQLGELLATCSAFCHESFSSREILSFLSLCLLLLRPSAVIRSDSLVFRRACFEMLPEKTNEKV